MTLDIRRDISASLGARLGQDDIPAEQEWNNMVIREFDLRTAGAAIDVLNSHYSTKSVKDTKPHGLPATGQGMARGPDD
jgi:hypothetical protein